MKLKFYAETYTMQVAYRLFSLLRYPTAARAFGNFLGWLGWVLVPRVRKRSLSNLRIAFPEKSELEIKDIAQKSYKHLGFSTYQFEWSGSVAVNDLLSRISWEKTGLDEFKKAGSDKKGIVLIVGHLGNWEILNHAIVLETRLQLNAYAARLANPLSGKVVEKLRTRFGAKFHEPRMVNSPDLMRALKKGEIAGFVADQNAGSRGLFVPFLGQLASTHKGPAVYAALSGAPAFFGVCLAGRDGNFRCELLPLGRCVEKSPEAILDFTARWVDLLEKYVRLYPEQYFWMHNRWKSRPSEASIISPGVKSDLQPYPKTGAK